MEYEYSGIDICHHGIFLLKILEVVRNFSTGSIVSDVIPTMP